MTSFKDALLMASKYRQLLQVNFKVFFGAHRKVSSKGQFHNHFLHIFYAHRSQKHKKTDGLTVYIFALLGSLCVKASHKMLVKSADPERAKKDSHIISIFWRFWDLRARKLLVEH